jgi:hypothetical protein
MSQKSEQAPDEFLSTEQAAEIAGVNVRTILRWWDAGLIGGQSIPIGSRTLRRVSRLSLQSYLAKNPIGSLNPIGFAVIQSNRTVDHALTLASGSVSKYIKN